MFPVSAFGQYLRSGARGGRGRTNSEGHMPSIAGRVLSAMFEGFCEAGLLEEVRA